MGGGTPRRSVAPDVTRRLLLDTHALIWWVAGDLSIGAETRAAIDSAELVLVSAISGYEIALKHATGRLPEAAALASDVAGAVRRAGFRELPIALAHAEAAGRLPRHHRDPFDRMLVAQALVEGLPLVSADNALDAFGVERIW
ncbi:MAG: type II toxin-antitoxin system VapC family toxin [Acetobacteraceae bacterium]|nr:type II toxin-antitoxin system VapC family toxin [Acetobacteraceae bacterium]